MKKTTAWFLACRPKTLTVSLSPVLVGTAIAWQQNGQLLWLPLLAAAFGAAFIQIGTNLFNDVGDFLRGTDQPGRVGPRRATAEGWLTPATVKAGAWASFALAFACGIYLVAHGGWPIIVIGLASLAAGWGYTSGPKPIAYGPLGEVFVLAFFGIIAVAGSYYLQTLTISWSSLIAGLQLGLLGAAVITVNNYRDLDGDQATGKRTLAVRLGRRATRWVYCVELTTPYLLLFLAERTAWGVFLSLPLALWLIRRFHIETPGPAFNQILAATAGLQFAFALLLSASFAL